MFSQNRNQPIAVELWGVFLTQANIFKMIKENFKKVKNTKKSYLDSIEKSYF